MTKDLLGEVLFHPDLTPKAVKRICEVIRSFKEKAEKWDALEMSKIDFSEMMDYSKFTERGKKLEAIRKQVIEPQLKNSKEYLDTHTKPEPHSIEVSRYWLEKGIYGIVLEIQKILEASD